MWLEGTIDGEREEGHCIITIALTKDSLSVAFVFLTFEKVMYNTPASDDFWCA